MTELSPATSWKDRPLTILGLSKSGLSVAEYVLAYGGRVFLSEVLPATPGNESQRKAFKALGGILEMGGHTKQVYTHSPQVVVSPGIPPSSPVINQLKISGLEVISEVEFAYRENAKRESHRAQWIAITGTNGKTTTTTLLSEILQASGNVAPACGNIGLPVITCINETQPGYESPDILVAELSSFQLEFSPTLTADIAVFLNLAPDHLNWHGSLESYTRAKLRLFTGAQSPKWVVFNAEDPLAETLVQHTTANLFAFSRNPDPSSNKAKAYENRIYVRADGMIVLEPSGKQPVSYFNVADLSVKGVHNQDNMMAAMASAYLSGVSKEQIIATCLNFSGVEHRLEKVTVIKTDQTDLLKGEGVAFYNDSKATNTDATVSALQAFGNDPVILIAGGRDKNEPLERLTEAIDAHASSVILIGEAQVRFGDALREKGVGAELYCSKTLEKAVEKAFSLSCASGASTGNPILFSPACASFDLYKNFEERGQAFKRFVYNIKESIKL